MDYATFQSTYANSAGTFADNTTRQISEADLRQFASDILGSFAMSASSNLTSQLFEIGDFNMSNSGAQITKQVYCGPSSNAINTKFFGVEIIADDTALLPRHKLNSPYFSAGNSGPALFNGALRVDGASSVLPISASGFITSGSDYDTASNYNRGYVTLFF